MKKDEIMNIFSKSNAYQLGHFKLSSGLHSGAYLQCALVLQDPIIASRLCTIIADKFRTEAPDVIIGPAMGGIVIAYEMARVLKARAIFTERNDNGNMVLRRGFRVFPYNKVLIAEDVLTTGKSIKEVISFLQKDDIVPVGIVSLVDRSNEKIDFNGIKVESLIKLDIPTFEEKDCPLCQEGLTITKPGSRKI